MFDFVNDSEMTRLRGQLKDLLALEDGLSGWEIKFIERLSNWEGNFSKNQAKSLDMVYQQLC